jgi:type IV secretion system protein VirB10
MKNPAVAVLLAIGITAGILPAQESSPQTRSSEDIATPRGQNAEQRGFKRLESRPANENAGEAGKESPEAAYLVDPGTRILLNMINSVSTRQAAVGDRIYLETAFPVLSNGKVVIPQGSWVQGSVTQVKRPGRVKGRGELYVRFDSLTLPNGVTRDFRARIGTMDGRSTEEVNKEEGKIKANGNKGGDATRIAETTAAGAGLGSLAGYGAGHAGMGTGIGAAAGAAGGLAAVLLSRGPDATLTKGTTLEMVLDRQLSFTDSELDFSHIVPRASLSEGTGPVQPQSNSGGRRWPL